jgi:hypothetical protein
MKRARVITANPPLSSDRLVRRRGAQAFTASSPRRRVYRGAWVVTSWGWLLYIKDGKPAYAYNWLGLKQSSVASDRKLVPGKATIVFSFAYDGGVGKGVAGTLSVNGEKVAEARIDQTQCCIFSMDRGG